MNSERRIETGALLNQMEIMQRLAGKTVSPNGQETNEKVASKSGQRSKRALASTRPGDKSLKRNGRKSAVSVSAIGKGAADPITR